MFVAILCLIVCFSFCLQGFSVGSPDDPLLDQQMAAKYGLDVPSPAGSLDPAPLWLQKADMFLGSSGGVWENHQFVLKEIMTERIVRARAGHRRMKLINYYPVETVSGFNDSKIRGVSLVSHVPHSKEAFQYAHEKGFRVIPYVHFLCIHINYMDQDVFYFEHPEILLKDAQGRWANTLMDGTYRLHRFLTCANSPSYWKLSLAYVKKLMDWGADGLFIDNVRRRQPCLGPRFNRPGREFEPYVHEHLFPDATHDYAWDRMLQAIRVLVKSYGEDKIVVLNSGIDTQFQKNGDSCMWESFIFSWAWEGRRHTWDDVKDRARKNGWYLQAGRRIVASSYIDASRPEAKEDAFWAFSAARLVDFIFWENLDDTGAELLYRAHMGRGLEPFEEVDRVARRVFENGIIVLNDSMEDREIQVPLPGDFAATELVDVYEGSNRIRINNRTAEVAVPKKKARVYLVPSELEAEM